MKTVCPPILIATLCLALLAGCAAPRQGETPRLEESSKITFSLDNIRPDGSRGSPDGVTSVAYEFCVPADAKTYQAVRQIDPSVKIYPGSRGRIGCSANEALCIGETHQPNWRQILLELAAQPYIAEIRECFFE